MKIPHFITVLGKFFPLIIDDDGYPIVKLANASGTKITVPDDLSSLTKVTSNPGDKLPAIYDQLYQYVNLASTGTGASYIYTDYVPDGYIWHIQSFNIRYSGAVTGRIFAIQLFQDTFKANIWFSGSIDVSTYQYIPYNFYLMPGYRLAFYISSVEAGKNQALNLAGVTMRVVV